MRTTIILLTFVISQLCATFASAADVKVGFHQFTIRDGFEIQLVAGPDLVERPIALSIDEQGAMYVTDSAGMSDRANEQLKLKPHRIRKLIDKDADGVYDESTLFAEGMMFPEGCLWHEGSLYVAAPPEIWKLTDTDGDGKSDQREVWFNGGTLTGCGNDLHGPYLGPDGWFYWCKGAFAEQKHTVHGREFTTRSSHIFRALPDGSRMEPVLTGGMDNPVNVAFLDNGDRFLSCTFFQRPANGQRDGLIHSIYGGVYGKKHDSIYEHPMTGSVMPVLTHMGAAAPCGLLAVDTRTHLFGRKHNQRSLFACYFNLHKVVHHELLSNGSTFTTRDYDLVACDHPDFHPTDVQQAPDGSLLIVDTGGWYKICCPTSQLAKPDVFGGIYRVTRTGQTAVDDPLGRQLPWDKLTAAELVDRLQDDRKFVRDRAVRALRNMGPAALPALRDSIRKPVVGSRVIQTLAGMDLPQARDLIRDASDYRFDTSRNAALSAISLWRDRQGVDEALKFVSNSSPRTARLAAEALVRLGDDQATPLLLKALTQRNFVKTDFDETGSPTNPAVRVREHAFINALIELGDADGTRAGLQSADPHAIRGALVALDQMPGTHLDAAGILPLLKHSDVAVSRTAAWVVGHHPEWGSDLVEFYTNELAQVSPETQPRLTEQLGRLARSSAIQDLLQRTLKTGPAEQRLAALQAMTQSGLSSMPNGWLDETARTLPELSPDLQTKSIAQVRQWPLPKQRHPGLNAALLAIAKQSAVDEATRADALLVASPLSEIPEDLFAWLLTALGSDPERGLRTPAARVLGLAKVSPQQQSRMLPVLGQSGPFELAALLPALGRGNKEFGHSLLVALENAPGFTGLRVDQLQAVLAKYPESIQTAGRPLLKRLNASVEEQTAHLESLLAVIKPGDARRGHEIFNSKQAKCITCHTRAYNGGRLGPDLTNIGKVRNTRDLLEAIIYPSASLVRGYEPVSVELTNGRVLSGIIRSESRDQIVLALDADKLQPISRSDIEEIHPSSVSLMPKGVDKILTAQDLSDLITFLQQ